MSHQEKQSIFDEYAKSQGFEDFLDSMYEYWSEDNSLSHLISHIFAACDLVQAELQRRIAEKEENISGDDFYFSGVPVEKIINPENLIK